LICKANDVARDRALERIMRDHTHASCARMTWAWRGRAWATRGC